MSRAAAGFWRVTISGGASTIAVLRRPLRCSCSDNPCNRLAFNESSGVGVFARPPTCRHRRVVHSLDSESEEPVMRIPRLAWAAVVIGAGLLLSGCVASGYGPGPVYYGGYGWAHGGRYTYPAPRVAPTRHQYRHPVRPRPRHYERHVYRGWPDRPPARYYRDRSRYWR